MKLRNRKTGDIKDFALVVANGSVDDITLTKLNEEWEDYEEPKEYWYIDYDGGILCGERDNSSAEKMMISMGNHFETIEEAEKAVRKLEAWKRLGNKGFRFTKWTIPEEPKTPHIKIVIEAEMDVPDSPYDLDLLLSREDD